jgi:hexulose-6-phosphate isomerase
MMGNQIGVMQGRLLPPGKNRIQSFPTEHWQQEFIAASRLSLDCIEFIFDGKEIRNHPLLTGTGREEIRYLMNRYGIRVNSVCADYFMRHPLHAGNKVRIPETIRIFSDLLIGCASLGMKIIVLPCVDASRIKNNQDISLLRYNLKGLLKIAERLDLWIALETDLPPEDVRSLLGLIGSDAIRINYDTGNSASLGYDPVRELSQYGAWICDVHIKDRLLGGSTVPLGTGDTRFEAFFPALREADYQGQIILQAAREETGSEGATVRGQIAFLKHYLGRAEG